MRKTYVYDKNTDSVVEAGASRSFNSLPGISITVYKSPVDGSILEKPMSQSYMNHIRSRNSESLKKMKPNMGAYGA